MEDELSARSAAQLAETQANFTSPVSSTAQQQIRTRSKGEERSSAPRRCAAHVFRGSLPGAAGPPPLLQGARSCAAQVAGAEGFSGTSRRGPYWTQTSTERGFATAYGMFSIGLTACPRMRLSDAEA